MCPGSTRRRFVTRHRSDSPWISRLSDGACCSCCPSSGSGSRWRSLIRSWSRRREIDPKRLARRLARRFEPAPGLPSTVAARRVTESLADYLRRVVGRPPGALTPEEARLGIARVVGDGELARRAGRLVADCDRARYAGAPKAPGRRTRLACSRTRGVSGNRSDVGNSRGGGEGGWFGGSRKATRGTRDRKREGRSRRVPLEPTPANHRQNHSSSDRHTDRDDRHVDRRFAC